MENYGSRKKFDEFANEFNEFAKDYKWASGANSSKLTPHQHNIDVDGLSTSSKPVLTPAQGLVYLSKIQDQVFGGEQASGSSTMGSTTPFSARPLYQLPLPYSQGIVGVATPAPIGQLDLPPPSTLPIGGSRSLYDPIRSRERWINPPQLPASPGTPGCPPKSTTTQPNILQGPTTSISSPSTPLQSSFPYTISVFEEVMLSRTSNEYTRRDEMPEEDSRNKLPPIRALEHVAEWKVLEMKAELAKTSRDIANLKAENTTASQNLEVAMSKWKLLEERVEFLEELTGKQDQKLSSGRLEAETPRKAIPDMSEVKSSLSVTTLAALVDSLEVKLKHSEIQLSEFTSANAALVEENNKLREAETALTLRVGDLEDAVTDSKLKLSNLTRANEGLITHKIALVQATEKLKLAVDSQGMLLKELLDNFVAKLEHNDKLVHGEQRQEAIVKDIDKEITDPKTEVEASHCVEELTVLPEVSAQELLDEEALEVAKDLWTMGILQRILNIPL